ncbi:MAG: reverse transcriptase domain-containing protein [Caldilineaceae bacterium]|nr:reverse transcriptase domain-containing protein [Caldilineaceae bacterium]
MSKERMGSRMAKNHTLLDIAYKCGVERYVLKDVYRRMLDKELFLIAYGNLASNRGALTPGTDAKQTIDGMSEERVERLIQSLKDKTFRWTPSKRVRIPKARGGTRPLGLPNWNDKLVQEVIRMVLESYYEPQFKECSHGFRPQRSCHTALKDIKEKWNGIAWFVEGDIKGCFDNISHTYLMRLLEEKIKDTQFLKLIRKMLKAGYMENWKETPTFSGTPQGGIISPLLSNIVLNELDKHMTEELIPEFNKGEKRKFNPEYWKHRRMYLYNRKKGRHAKAKERKKLMQKLPSGDPQDGNFRRLKYIRYADDFLIGIIGSKEEAETVKEEVRKKLSDMQLEMSEEKTLVTHARTQHAKFLGFEISISSSESRMSSLTTNGRRHKKRTAMNAIVLKVPPEVIRNWRRKYSTKGKPRRLHVRTNLSDLEIIEQYGSEMRGLTNYYMPAANVSKAIGKVNHFALHSAVKTLAHKYKEKEGAIWRKYWIEVETGKKALYAEVPKPQKPGQVYKAMCGETVYKAGTFHTKIEDKVWTPSYDSNELVKRLTAQRCELCGKDGRTEVHHIRKLKDLSKKWAGRKQKPDWVKLMIQRQRKTLPVCPKCHKDIHAGRYDGNKVGNRLESSVP